MNNRRVLFIDIVSDLNIFLLIFSAMSVPAYVLTNDMFYVYAVGFSAVPFFICMIIRRSVRSFIVFIVPHILLEAIAIAAPVEIRTKVLLIILFTVINFYSLSRKLTGSKSEVNFGNIIVSIGVNAGVIALISYLKLPIPTSLLIFCSITSAVCYILCTHVSNVNYSLEIISGSAIQPVSEILRFNNVVILLFVILVMAMLFISRYLYIDKVLEMLWDGLLAIFGLFFTLSEPEEVQRSFNNNQTPFTTMQDLFGKPDEPSWLLVLLEKIIVFLAWVGIFVAVVFGVGYFIYRMYKQFYDNASGGYDEKEFVVPLIFEKAGLRGFSLSNLLPRYGSSPAQRVRRLFYKRVKNQMDKGIDIDKSATAREIIGKLGNVESTAKLGKLYEKARYSDAEVTKEELRSVERGV